MPKCLKLKDIFAKKNNVCASKRHQIDISRFFSNFPCNTVLMPFVMEKITKILIGSLIKAYINPSYYTFISDIFQKILKNFGTPYCVTTSLNISISSLKSTLYQLWSSGLGKSLPIKFCHCDSWGISLGIVWLGYKADPYFHVAQAATN